MATLFEAPFAPHEFESEFESPEAYEYEMHEAAASGEYENPETNEYEVYGSLGEYELESPEAYEYETAMANGEYEFENLEAGMEHEFESENPEAYEFESENPEAYEFESENPEAYEFENPEYELENEFEFENPEYELENEFEFEGESGRPRRRRRRGFSFAGLARLARQLAPGIAGKLASIIPGAGLIAAPLAAKLTASLVREGESESLEMEAHLFGTNEANPEVGSHESSQEAALTELFAAEAAASSGVAEAVSVLSASLPVTITIMGGRRGVRRVLPALTQANAALVRSLAAQGPGGRQLLRAVPTIQRQTISTLRAANRQGRPLTSPLAVQSMAAATRNVLGNPQRVGAALQRNAVIRRRVAPPTFGVGRPGPMRPPYGRVAG